MSSLLAPLIGPESAAAFIRRRINALTTHDLLPYQTAERVVLDAIRHSDPWILAEHGQVWSDLDDVSTVELYVVERRGAHALLEDEYGQRERLNLSALDQFVLTWWEYSPQPNTP